MRYFEFLKANFPKYNQTQPSIFELNICFSVFGITWFNKRIVFWVCWLVVYVRNNLVVEFLIIKIYRNGCCLLQLSIENWMRGIIIFRYIFQFSPIHWCSGGPNHCSTSKDKVYYIKIAHYQPRKEWRCFGRHPNTKFLGVESFIK